MELTPPVSNFIRSTTSPPLTITKYQRGKLLSTGNLLEKVAALHPIVHNTLKENWARSRLDASRRKLPNFVEGDFVLVSREEFHAGEKLALRWRGPRRVVKALNDLVYQAEDLRNGDITDVICRLKFHSDSSLDTKAIISPFFFIRMEDFSLAPHQACQFS